MSIVSNPSPLAAERVVSAVQAGPLIDWVTSNTGAFITGSINIVIIVVLALVARVIVGRLITHVVRRMVDSHQRMSKMAGAVGVLGDGKESKANRQQARAQTLSSVLRSIASFVIFGVAFMMLLAEFGINLGPILASAGVLGLAIGFGAQALVQDFLSGTFMMIEDQYGVGDVVDVGDAVGTVEEVGLRITKVRDLSGGLWYIRNGEITRVCNMNQDWANAIIDFPLDYSVDISLAKEVIERSISEFTEDPEFSDKLMERPEINGIVGVGDGAMTVRVMAKTQPGEQWALGRALRAHLKQSFDAANVQVAHPVLSLSSSRQG
ncbi:mechanosensitive ion channel family protein [Salinactinospora qingdaonensis]|uniref:Mechanosensitive ion channel family protein n=1 Tax=Salinactinospora qingdaonensis TaxID=702744 RepID=A0ABP7GGR4_9ACTN